MLEMKRHPRRISDTFCALTMKLTCRIGLPILLATLCLGVAGCGSSSKGPAGYVSGKVTLNGNPVSNASVVFSSSTKGFAAEAKLDPAGAFRLTDSLPVGDYVVTVKPPPAPPPLGAPVAPSLPKSDIPEKYRSEEKSDLKFPIKAGANTANFDLKP